MKPRIFIGSSTEALDVAYAIQESLEYDSNPTVWTQGIFELSSNSLDDLIKALDNFDFGIFVFKLDDVTEMRSKKLNTVRDNVIFELGLFIGRLGKKRVFFVLPDSTTDFHLPTDLIGFSPGRYNDSRKDGNLNAALGPFCNQVRKKLKSFVVENLLGLKNESKSVRKIAFEKAEYWEFLLSSELLKSRLKEINRSYEELEKGLVFQKSKSYDIDGFCEWLSDSTQDLIRLIGIFKRAFEIELIKAYGEPGIAGNVFEIKSVVDKIDSVCKELLAWEYNLQGIIPPDELKEVPELLKGSSKALMSTINEFPKKLDEAFLPENLAKSVDINLELTFPPPPNHERIMRILEEVRLGLR